MSAVAAIAGTLGVRGSGLAVAPVPPLRIAPAVAGTGSGESWANAGGLAQLNGFIAQAAATGAEVWLRADMGTYTRTTTLPISAGGSANRPVVVRGVDADGGPAKARIAGARAASWSKGAAYGAELLWLNAGASHLVLSHLDLRDHGVCIRARGSISNLTVTDVDCLNAGKFFQNYKASGAVPATIHGLTIRRATGDYVSGAFIDLRYDTHGVLVEDCDVNMRSIDKDWISCCYKLDGTAHDVVWRRAKGRNVYNSGPGSYWNGDIFSSERGNYNVTFEDTEAFDATDRGYDVKGTNHYFLRARAERCKRNWCVWGDSILDQCIGVEPVKLGGTASSGQVVAIEGGRAIVRNSTFTAGSNGNAPFRTLDYGFLFVDGASQAAVAKPAGVPMFQTEGTIDMLYGTLDYADHVPPYLTSTTALTLNENVPATFLTAWSEAVTLSVRGPDAAQIAIKGRALILSALDYERPGGAAADGTNVLKFEVQGMDANGNVSPWTAMTLTVQDVADDPIGPAEIVSATGATDAVIYDLSVATSLWADAGRTEQAVADGPLALVDDLSGFAHHLRFDPEITTFRADGGRPRIEFRGDNVGEMGMPGDFRWAQQTAVVAVERDHDDGSSNSYILFTARRSTSPGASGNGAFWLGFADTSSVIYRTNSQNGTTPGVGGEHDVPLILSYRASRGIIRRNGVQVRDDADTATNQFFVAGDQPLMGARFDGTNRVGFLLGELSYYAGVNVDVADVSLLNRIERQAARTNGAVL